MRTIITTDSLDSAIFPLVSLHSQLTPILSDISYISLYLFMLSKRETHIVLYAVSFGCILKLRYLYSDL